ncbi:penicillin acylase family protein [Halobacteriales archaeon Cl-PHB]
MSRRQRLVGVASLAVLLTILVVAGQFVQLLAPFAGAAYDGTSLGGGTVESPYGEASVTYDEYGVPHVEAENERALAYAVGYVQARDRLFQMDLYRRMTNGTLSEVAGNATVQSDRFHRQMGFRDAAEASWDRLEGTAHGDRLEAYSAGVNHFIQTEPLPMEFRLNDYEPQEWTPVDSLLVGQQMAWQLSGGFEELEQATISRQLPRATDLYPRQLSHDEAIIRESAGQEWNPNTSAETVANVRAVYESVRSYEGQPGLGSNNWLVSGNHTESGDPILANDPHLTLTAPPIWYEMHQESPKRNVRGVGFPGVPFVVIGTNEEVAWGVTNVGADVTDHYTYRWQDGRYWYDGEWRQPETRAETIHVNGGPDRTVTVRRTVHGPVLSEENQRVAVAWTGLTATTLSRSADRLSRSENLTDVENALREWDVPAQSFLAIDRDGGTMYYPAGKYPIRKVDGERVPGNRIFNGSAGNGEWRGFEAYGRSNWSGFVAFEDIPHLDDPDYVGTANQRVVDEPGFYMGTSQNFADPYRGARIYDRLGALVESEDPVTRADLVSMQRDTYSTLAASLTPVALEGKSDVSEDADWAVRALETWNYRMDRDSKAALVFDRWRHHFRNETFGDEYYGNGLDASYYPRYWTLQELPANSSWYDDRSTQTVETRRDIAARALEMAVEDVEAEGWETYGDYNEADLDHPFPLSFLDYPEAPTDGAPYTLRNYRVSEGDPVGSSWQMVVDGESALGVIPGGNSGRYFSPHYADQFDLWRNGEYKPLTWSADGGTTIVFEEGGS